MSDSSTPPLFAGTILGLRAWLVETPTLDGGPDDLYLGSYVAEGAWERGGRWTVARCKIDAGLGTPYLPPHRRRPHAVPLTDCSCGLYAWHPEADRVQALWDEHLKHGSDPDPCHPEMNGILGVIEACGRIELHREGFRAERARVRALIVRRDWPAEMIDRVHYIADLYQARLLRLDRPGELLAYFREQKSALTSEQVSELVGPEEVPGEQFGGAAGSSLPVPTPPSGPFEVAGRAVRKLGEVIGMALILGLGVLFYGSFALAAVLVAGEILFGWFDTGPKPPPAARVTKVAVNREKCSVSAQLTARKPVEELTLRATGRDVDGKGFGHLTDNFGPIARGTTWVQVGELKHKVCRSSDPFTIRVRAIFPSRVGKPASVRVGG